MKKNYKHVILFIGFIVYVLGLLITGMSFGIESIIYFNTVISIIYPILTIAFCVAQTKTLNVLGYAINSIAGVYALTLLIQGDFEETAIIMLIGLVIMMCVSICYLTTSILKFFGFVKAGKATASSNEKIELLRLYSELNKNEIITDEEFAEIKTSVIKGNIKDNTVKLNQIKELKKLYDEQVITKDEFITFNK